jgi:hypothetical protein
MTGPEEIVYSQQPEGNYLDGQPITSLAGLLDLLTMLEDQLAACPGAIPVLAYTLRDEREGVVDDDR